MRGLVRLAGRPAQVRLIEVRVCTWNTFLGSWDAYGVRCIIRMLRGPAFPVTTDNVCRYPFLFSSRYASDTPAGSATTMYSPEPTCGSGRGNLPGMFSVSPAAVHDLHS